MTNREFLSFANKNINKYPDYLDLEIEIQEDYRKRISCLGTGSALYYSCLLFDEKIGIYEEIYGAKLLQGQFKIQKLAVIPEDTNITPVFRNIYYNDWGCNKGYHSYGYNGKGTYYHDYNKTFFSDNWFDLQKFHRTELFSSEDIADLDEKLKYNAYRKDAYYIYALDYIRLYRKYPTVCETLMKVGIFRMFTEKALKTMTENNEVLKYICKNQNDCKFMAFQTAYNAFKKNKSGSPKDYEKSLMYRIQCGKEVAFTNRQIYEKALKFANQEKFAKYLKDNKIGAESYGDYLTACDWLKLDFSDTKVLFPHNFNEVHDTYTTQYGIWKAEQDAIEEKKRLKEEERREKIRAKAEQRRNATISERMLQTAQKFSFLAFKSDTYCVLVAQNKIDLIDEGCALQHCVGRMDYDRRQADGTSVICFIRKADAINKPFVTAEVKINGKKLSINQCYGFKDSVVEEVQPFCEKWIQNSNQLYKKVA